MEAHKRFDEILKEVQRTQTPAKTFPCVALEHLGATRRGWRVVQRINKLLDEHDLICEPDFGSAWYYGAIEIKPKPKVPAGSMSDVEDNDPTPRISLLRAANLNKVAERGGTGLVSVHREAPLYEATTLMMMHDYSQLPILSGQRKVEGLVSWKSIGRALSLGKECRTVFECREDVVTVCSHY